MQQRSQRSRKLAIIAETGEGGRGLEVVVGGGEAPGGAGDEGGGGGEGLVGDGGAGGGDAGEEGGGERGGEGGGEGGEEVHGCVGEGGLVVSFFLRGGG